MWKYISCFKNEFLKSKQILPSVYHITLLARLTLRVTLLSIDKPVNLHTVTLTKGVNSDIVLSNGLKTKEIWKPLLLI